MPSEVRIWRGALLKRRLFVGSKSEGDFWILLARDGYWYRISLDLPEHRLAWLEEHEGEEVELLASLDLLRGHRRLVLNDVQSLPNATESRSEDDKT